MAVNWQMREVAKACANCGRAFEDGQQYHSMLEIEHNDLLCATAQRNDYCVHCWQDAPHKAGEGLDSFSWKGVFRSREKKRDSTAVRKGMLETMLAYLRGNIGNQERRVANLLFALAVILERKRVLVPCAPDGENTAMLVYTHAKSGESFLLRPPDNIEEDKDFINISIQELSITDAEENSTPGDS